MSWYTVTHFVCAGRSLIEVLYGEFFTVASQAWNFCWVVNFWLVLRFPMRVCATPSLALVLWLHPYNNLSVASHHHHITHAVLLLLQRWKKMMRWYHLGVWTLCFISLLYAVTAATYRYAPSHTHTTYTKAHHHH